MLDVSRGGGRAQRVDFDTFVISKIGDKVQSIGFYNSRNNELAYLVTNPDNNNHPINKDCRVRGAGTSVVSYLIGKDRRPFILDAVRKAVPFYQRLGFVADITRLPHERGEIPMIHTAVKVHAVVVARVIN